MSIPLTANQSTVIGTQYDVVNNGPSTKKYGIMKSFSGRLVSHGNPRGPSGNFVSGGFFSSYKYTVERSGSTVSTARSGWQKKVMYTGLFTITVPSNPLVASGFGLPSTDAQARGNLERRGAEYWNRLRPDKPDFSVGTELLESRDIPGMLKDSVKGVHEAVKDAKRLRFHKSNRRLVNSAGDWHLAIQFGWLPVLRSVRGFIKSFREKDDRLKRLIKNAGKPQHRKTNITDGDTESKTQYASLVTDSYGLGQSPPLVTQCFIGKGHRSITYSYEVKRWAEGSFSYFLPPGPRDLAWNRKMYRRIMGGRITPAQLYAAMPWSWFIDYFVDLGSFMNSVSAGVADRLAAHYCYLMETTEYKTNVQAQWTMRTVASTDKNDAATQSVTASAIGTESRKIRVVASPFGFGIRQSDLSASQVAILGALGLSRI